MNKNYVLPFYFASNPTPSVLMNIELREVKAQDSKHFGKYRIAMDSHYNPIREEIEKIDMAGYITLEQAEKIMTDFKCIPVKEGFDGDNIEDLREIKHLLPEEWINGYNSAQSMW